MGIRFSINSWAACAPGLTVPAQWEDWARAPTLPTGLVEAPLTAMAALLRRRLGPLGRSVGQAAWDCQRAHGPMPVVLASRYGDVERALRLLQDAAIDAPLSPTDFTLSVHNAIGAVYAIARADTCAYTSVAAGASSAAAGLIEAAALLADGAPEVLLVCYDTALPSPYESFGDEPSCTYAWAWRLAPAMPGHAHFDLEWCADDALPAQDDAHPLPFGLHLQQFMLSQSSAMTRRSGGKRWTWRRRAATA